MARDWATTLFPSSFAGVPFWVEADDIAGRKRLVIHDVAGSDRAAKENFGLSPDTFTITAYTVGDTADMACAALVAALKTNDSGIMIMPAEGPVVVWPEQWRRSRSRDRMGYFALDISFVGDDPAAGYSLDLSAIASAFASGLVAASAAFGSTF